MTHIFDTDTIIPIEAFTTFGINAKPNSHNPIGFFGTGLKYAVSIILRMGGKIHLFVDGVEYEFYTKDTDFRGKAFKSVRMKKRRGFLSAWKYEALPFTTELGKNWELWQAYRELESNTRDENGVSAQSADDWHELVRDIKGRTIIVVEGVDFEEDVTEGNEVFLNNKGKLVYQNQYFSMYDVPSKYLYYRGVRVYDMRYPARFTYDFKQGHVNLSEDRSATNSWLLFHYISRAIMGETLDKSIIYKALNHPKDSDRCFFEGHDLSYSTDYGSSLDFREVARKLHMKGFATSGVSGAHLSMSRVHAPKPETTTLELLDNDWEVIIRALATDELYEDTLKRVCEAGGWDMPTPKPKPEPEEVKVLTTIDDLDDVPF